MGGSTYQHVDGLPSFRSTYNATEAKGRFLASKRRYGLIAVLAIVFVGLWYMSSSEDVPTYNWDGVTTAGSGAISNVKAILQGEHATVTVTDWMTEAITESMTATVTQHTTATVTTTATPTPTDVKYRVIKITLAYGDGAIDEAGHTKEQKDMRERLLKQHVKHAEMHGHRQHIQRIDTMGDMYTKPATIMRIMLEELSKPKELQAEWILYHDADVVMMNHEISIEEFIPPADKDVNLLITKDLNGFNAGSFLIRVCPWSVQLLGGNLGYEFFPNRRDWEYFEQGMMANLIDDVEHYGSRTRVVPSRWLNAYPRGWGEMGFEDGDMQIHLVAWSKEFMPEYLGQSESFDPKYNPTAEASGLRANITQYWAEH